MSGAWSIMKLGEVSRIGYGYTTKASFGSDGIKFLRITDIQNGSVNWDEVPSCSSDPSDLDRYLLREGDIVFARTGATTGKSFLVVDPPPAVFASYLIRVQLEESSISSKFLSYYFQTKNYWDEIQAGVAGAAQGGFNATKLGNLEIPFPSPPEQNRIVAILDEAFEGIATATANAEKNLANARELFESYLNSRLLSVASSPPTQTLTCITDLIVDCEHRTAPTQASGFPSIRTPNIGKGELILEGVYRVSEETYKLWTRRAVPESGDLILAREAPAGNVGVVPVGLKVCLGQRTVLIRPNQDKVDSQYLAFLMLHPIMQSRLLSHSTGATVQHVNVKDIRKLEISDLPLIHEQQNAVRDVINAQQQVMQLRSIYKQKLNDLTELKQSILQKAFSGELTQQAA